MASWSLNVRNFLIHHQSSQKTSHSNNGSADSLLNVLDLPALRDEANKDKQNQLLIRKLSICCYRCDFRLAQQGSASAREVEKERIANKVVILSEMKVHLETSRDWHHIDVVTTIFDLVSSNLFRPVPDSFMTAHLMGVDHHIPITHSLPSWNHLSIVYEILHLTLSNERIPRSLLFDSFSKYRFIENVVALLDSADKTERQNVQSLLETMWMEYGDVFEEELQSKLVRYCLEFIHFGVGSAEAIKSILNVFNSMSLIDADLFVTVLLPLHRMEYGHFRHYEFVLWIYCKRIMEEDETLSLLLIKCLLRYWPQTNALKEQQFLKKIALILDFVEEDIWRDVDAQKHPMQCRLFQAVVCKMGHCLKYCNHYKTICDILDIVEVEEVQQFIEKYGGHEMWCHFYQALHDIATHFFYFETTLKTKETMEVLRDQDEIPMVHAETFRKIESGEIRMYPLSESAFGDRRSPKQQNTESQRKRKYDALSKAAQRNKRNLSNLSNGVVHREHHHQKQSSKTSSSSMPSHRRRPVPIHDVKGRRKPPPNPRVHTVPLPPSSPRGNGLKKEKKYSSSNSLFASNSNSKQHVNGGALSQRRDRQHQMQRSRSGQNIVNHRHNNHHHRYHPIHPHSSAASSMRTKPCAKPVISQSVPIYSANALTKMNSKKTVNTLNTVHSINNNNNNSIPPPPPLIDAFDGDHVHELELQAESKRIKTTKTKKKKKAVTRSTSYKIIPKKKKVAAPMDPHFSRSFPVVPPPPKIENASSSSQSTDHRHSAATAVTAVVTAQSLQNGNGRNKKISINSGDIVHSKKRHKFWPSSRLQLSATDSDKEALHKQQQREQKQREQEERVRLKMERQKEKAMEKEERQRVKEEERARKLKEKREKKELKQWMKEMKRAQKGRIRKSVDIDRRSSSISNPLPPKQDTVHFECFSQITANNTSNSYLNAQYYEDEHPEIKVRPITVFQDKSNLNTNSNHSNPSQPMSTPLPPDRSPKLQISSCSLTKFDPPKVLHSQSSSKSVHGIVTAKKLNAFNGRHRDHRHHERTPPKRHLPPNPHRKSSSNHFVNGQSERTKAAAAVHHKTSNSDTLWTRKAPPNKKLPRNQKMQPTLARAMPLAQNHPFRRNAIEPRQEGT